MWRKIRRKSMKVEFPRKWESGLWANLCIKRSMLGWIGSVQRLLHV
jgi:hypothetical protein